MNTQAMEKVTAALIKLSTANGLKLDPERIQIYVENLAKFTEDQVITSITWAMNNMSKFPMIADLRIQIEGSDEDHANGAWDAIMQLVYGGPTSTVVLYDVVMAKTIMTKWRDWPTTCKAIARISDDFSKTDAKRAFKLSYITHYKDRDLLRQELSCPVTLPGGPHPNEKTLVAYDLLEYTVNPNYAVEITERRTIQPYIDPKWGQMPADVKEKIDRMLNKMGDNNGRSNLLYPQTPKPRAVIPSPFLRSDTGDVDVERVRKYVQQRRANAEASSVPDDRTEGNAVDRDNAADTGGEQQPTPPTVICNCGQFLSLDDCQCGNKDRA